MKYLLLFSFALLIFSCKKKPVDPPKEPVLYDVIISYGINTGDPVVLKRYNLGKLTTDTFQSGSNIVSARIYDYQADSPVTLYNTKSSPGTIITLEVFMNNSVKASKNLGDSLGSVSVIPSNAK
jgi:hypothetical protein